MRNSDQQPHGRQGSPSPPLPSPAALALVLAALLASAALLAFVDAPQASAQDAPSMNREGQERARSDGAGGSGDGESANALGVIVDIPKGWPLNDGGGDHDIVRFEKCFPFCHVERPGGDSSQDGSSDEEGGTEERTSIIEQTQIVGETETGGDGTDEQYDAEDGSHGGEPPGGEPGGGNGGGGGGGDEQEPEEPTASEETTLLEETTTFGGTTAPPGGTAECPTGPSGPISEVTLTKVLDADTLQVEGSDGNSYTIRLIGAEAPDLAGGGAEGGQDEPGAEEAAEFARETLGGRGQKLELEYDEQKTDENGQTFAYVWTEGDAASPKPATAQLLDVDEAPRPVLFNGQLVEGGYARAATAEPNTDYADCLTQAEEAAREDGSGLWGEQSSSPETGSALGGLSGDLSDGLAAAPSPGGTNAQTNNGTLEAVSVELVSQKTPPLKRGAEAEAGSEAKAKDSAIPPITGHAKPPETTQVRAAHPELAIGLAVGLVAASLLAALVLTRGVGRTGAPAGAGTTEGGGN